MEASTHRIVLQDYMFVPNLMGGSGLISSKDTLGTVHFLPGRGGWWDLGGATPKKMALKGGHLKKIREKGVT